jgi:hypothetical protein
MGTICHDEGTARWILILREVVKVLTNAWTYHHKNSECCQSRNDQHCRPVDEKQGCPQRDKI